MDGWLHVSIWNEIFCIGQVNTSLQNYAPIIFITDSLNVSCRSMGNSWSCRLFYNYFASVFTSNSTISSLGSIGSFSCFNNLPQSLNTHTMPSLRSYDSSVYLQVHSSGFLYTFLPVCIYPYLGVMFPPDSDLDMLSMDMGWFPSIGVLINPLVVF